MKLSLNSIWLFLVLALAVSSCSEDEDDVVNRNPVKTEPNQLTLEDVLFTNTWEMYNWRTLQNRVIRNGVEQLHTETYAVTAEGTYEFIEGTTNLNVIGQFFVFGTVDVNDDSIFPDTTYNTPSVNPVKPYVAQYKILDDSTLVATAFSPDEMTAYKIEKDRIYLRQTVNDMNIVDTNVTTTTYVLEIDLAPAGTKLDELLGR